MGLQSSLRGQSTGASGSVAPGKDSQIDDARRVERPERRVDTGTRALKILRQEIRQVLSASFRIKYAATPTAYGNTGDPVSRGDVAEEVINGARAVADRAPVKARESLVKLRGEVETAARSARNIVGDEGRNDIAGTLGTVRQGLAGLEKDAARNIESSASVLSVESRLKQRSTIRIRTQEGDVVRLDLRRSEKLSAEDISMADRESRFASTSLEVSSRTRMALKVNGDLNEAEFAAIQRVFAQAEAIADEFFNGDLAAAFDMAAGIEFDSEQLARVKMRFVSSRLRIFDSPPLACCCRRDNRHPRSRRRL